MPITQTLRFDILRRDGFTCVYCGRKAPEVVLEVDHLIACANGGMEDSNLVTACRDCNRGKRAKPLGLEVAHIEEKAKVKVDAQSGHIKMICPNCQSEFQPKRKWQKFCSQACRHQSWFDKNFVRTTPTT